MHDRRWQLALALLLVAFAATATMAQTDDADRTLAPHFFVEGDPSVDRMPLESTSVTFDVVGVIADVTVRQVYRNEGTRPIHPRYVFPASTRAAVHGLPWILVFLGGSARSQADHDIQIPPRELAADVITAAPKWAKT